MEKYSIKLPERNFLTRRAGRELRFQISRMTVEKIDSDTLAEDFNIYDSVLYKPEVTIVTDADGIMGEYKLFKNVKGMKLSDMFRQGVHPIRGERSLEIVDNSGIGVDVSGLERGFKFTSSVLFVYLSKCVYNNSSSRAPICVYYYHDTDLDTIEDVISKSQGYKIVMSEKFSIRKADWMHF